MRLRVGVLVLILFLLLPGFAAGASVQVSETTPAASGKGGGAESDQEIYFLALRLFQRREYEPARRQLTRLLEEFPQSQLRQNAAVLRADTHFYLAKAEGKKRFVSVIDEYQNVMQQFPHSSLVPWMRLQIGRSYSAMGYFYEAQATFENFIDDFPKSRYTPYAILGVARAYFSMDRFAEAQVLFEKLSDRYPGTRAGIEGNFGVANAFYRLGQYDRAEVFYRQALKRYPEGDISSPDTLFSMGETLYQRGEYAEARKVFFELVNLHPDDPVSSKGMARIGDCYRRLGQTPQSDLMYQETAARYPYDEGGYISRIRLADVELQQSRNSRAISPPMAGVETVPRGNPLQSYREVVRANPTPALSEVAMIRLASAQRERRQFQAAIETLNTYLREYPYGILTGRARQILRQTAEEEIAFYRELGRNTAVVDIYQRMRGNVLDETADPKTIMQVGESFADLGLYRPAVEVYRDLLDRKKGAIPRERLLFLLGEAHWGSGDQSGAEEIFSAFVKSYPKSPLRSRALLRLGEISLAKGEPGGAYGFFAEAVRANPRFPQAALAFYHLGEIALKEKKYAQAAGFFANAIRSPVPTAHGEIDPVEESYFLMADSLFRLGKVKEALEGYAKARRLYPNSPRGPWAQLQTAVGYRDLGIPEKARPIFEELSAQKNDPFLARVAGGFLADLTWEEKSQPKVQKFLEAQREGAP